MTEGRVVSPDLSPLRPNTVTKGRDIVFQLSGSTKASRQRRFGADVGGMTRRDERDGKVEKAVSSKHESWILSLVIRNASLKEEEDDDDDDDVFASSIIMRKRL